DLNGIFVPAKYTKDQAANGLKGAAQNNKMGSVAIEQNIRYYDTAVQKAPEKRQDAAVVKESGFKLNEQADPKKPALLVQRKPEANNGAEKGRIINAGTKQWEVAF